LRILHDQHCGKALSDSAGEILLLKSHSGNDFCYWTELVQIEMVFSHATTADLKMKMIYIP
jgi:hypothetical protein